jgi:hypothetical protein
MTHTSDGSSRAWAAPGARGWPVTRDPDRVEKKDVDAVRVAGVSDEAIADGQAICFAFNLLNRLADAFGYSWNNERHRGKGPRPWLDSATKYRVSCCADIGIRTRATALKGFEELLAAPPGLRPFVHGREE